jgi:hypothetical protein
VLSQSNRRRAPLAYILGHIQREYFVSAQKRWA